MRKLLFAIEILVLAAVLGGLYYYNQVTSRIETIIETPEATVNDEGVLQSEPLKNEDVPELHGFKTIALFGIDHRDQNEALSGENSDTMIIASINYDEKEIRLVSVYRDTLVNIGDDIYAKANAAYAYGGAKQALTMLNTNLDLNISEYVTIDFNALAAAVDALDGLDIPLSYAEIVHMNNYCIETSEETGRDYTPVPLPEPKPEDQEAIVDTYHLNGVQVTSYCRIRFTASLDMGRTERQRRVIQMLVTKAKETGLTRIFDIMDEVFPMVKTNMTLTEILTLAPSLMGYGIGNTNGFPMEYRFAETRGSVIVPTDLISNVAELHEFLYGEKDYKPTKAVQERSETINSIVYGAENGEGQTTEPSGGEDGQGGDDDTDFLWQPDSTGSYNYYYGNTGNTGSGSGTSYGSGSEITSGTGTGTGSTDYSTGGTDYNTGGTGTSTGETDYSTGGTDYNAGGTGTSTGGTDYSAGGTDYSSGGTDTGTGGTDYNAGGTDYSTGGTDYSSGGTDYSAGGVDTGAVGTDYSTGGTDAAAPVGDELTSGM